MNGKMKESGSAGVTLRQVGVAYDHHTVVSDIDLEVLPGEFFTFLGPSGSGKSTLLRAIAGFGPPPRGRIRIGNRDITNLHPWRRDVGMVFQNYALWPHMTVRKNVAFGLQERRRPAAEIRSRVDAALDLVGLSEFAQRRPGQLSGGQQQRVALARTVVIEPRVLLLDEPLSNLDANLRIRMRQEIRGLQQRLGITTIYVTHDQEEANTVSDRIAVLRDGKLQQVGSPMSLYDHPENSFVAQFLGAANLLAGEIRHSGVRGVFRSESGLNIPLQEAAPRGGAVVLLRPHNLRIAARDTTLADHEIEWNGAIRNREFLGHLVRYQIDTGGQDLLVDEEHAVDEPMYALGTRVRLAVDGTQIRLLGRGPGNEPPRTAIS